MARPVSKVIPKKKPAYDPKPSKTTAPAQSVEDWDKQEAAEVVPIPPAPDMISAAIGRKMCVAPYRRSTFRTAAGQPFGISRFYPGVPGVCFDKPDTEAEHDAKTAHFATVSDLVYLAVKPDEALTPEQLRARLNGLLQAHSKRKAA